MFLRHGHGFFLAGLLLMSATATACADEGMWVFNNLPLGMLKARYGFEPPPLWAEHLRSSAVRFNNGGSGSFVSADGLIMTNHHVGADTLSKLGTKVPSSRTSTLRQPRFSSDHSCPASPVCRRRRGGWS